MSTEKFPYACIQAYGPQSTTSNMMDWDDAWALKSAQMLVYRRLGTIPKLIVWWIGTKHEHWKVPRCLYTSHFGLKASLVCLSVLWSIRSVSWFSTSIFRFKNSRRELEPQAPLEKGNRPANTPAEETRSSVCLSVYNDLTYISKINISRLPSKQVTESRFCQSLTYISKIQIW